MGKRKFAPDEGASGSSSQQEPPQAHPRTASSSSKRQRRDPQSSDATPEKRGAIFKKSCPKNILERVGRVMSQRFFMIDRRREGEKLCEEFKVLGSTGNVYTVTISRLPSCDCPDAARGNHCKHIVTVLRKWFSHECAYLRRTERRIVLQVPQSSGLWYQKALLVSELQSIFANAPQAPNALAHDNVREAYARATGKAPALAPSGPRRRIPGPEDSCPICYETMHGISENKLVFCEECGNALHTECFGQWRRSAAKLTCVWCRAEWTSGEKGGTGASSSSGGYINLGSLAGLSGQRDTSSYHHSWQGRNKAGRA